MNIIVVDDEQKAVKSLLRVLYEVEPEADVVSFTQPEDAFRYLAGNEIHIAFLDINMGGMTGLELAERCNNLCPTINIIFVTGYSKYSMDALKLHVSGYLMKPVRVKDLRTELDNLRHPVLKKEPLRIRINTFGSFDVFVDGRPFPFPTAKCKEAFAYLVDRKGVRVTYSQLSGILWEDSPYDRTAQNNTHGTIFKLMKALSDLGLEELIIKGRKDIAVDPKMVECDYYAALDGDKEAEDTFMGEYMSNYSWAELTLSVLCRKIGQT